MNAGSDCVLERFKSFVSNLHFQEPLFSAAGCGMVPSRRADLAFTYVIAKCG
jgi:hypothetical protein